MKLLRVCILVLFVSAAFAQRGGSHGGGGSRVGGGSGFHGGSSGFRGGGSLGHGGYSRGYVGGGYSYGRGYGYSRGYGYGGYSRYGFGVGFGLGYWGYPGYYGYGYYPYSYYPYYDSYYPSTGYVSAPYSYYDSAPVVISQNYGTSQPAPPPARVREYSSNRDSSPKETIYLIAFKDHRIQAALTYWVEGGTVHYITRDHEHKEVALEGIDRPFSEQINRDRHVEFRLPR